MAVRVVLSEDEVAVLERLQPNTRRKGDVVGQLLRVADARLAEIQRGDAPLDELTKALLGLEFERKRAQREEFDND